MNKIILPLIVIIAILFVVVGLIGDNKEAIENSAIVTISGTQELDKAIENGPVLVEIGTDSCPACVAQKPIMADISTEYQGKATVAYINAKSSGALAASFNVYSIPDSFIIVDNKDNGYVYMGPDGNTTMDRNMARFIGLTSKGALTDVLDAAIQYRQ